MAAPAPPEADETGAGDCAVCWSAKVTSVLTACGHSVLCTDCLERIMAGPQLPKCPLCSTPIPPRAWRNVSDVEASSFHPESIATEHGHALLANFVRLAGIDVKALA